MSSSKENLSHNNNELPEKTIESIDTATTSHNALDREEVPLNTLHPDRRSGNRLLEQPELPVQDKHDKHDQREQLKQLEKVGDRMPPIDKGFAWVVLFGMTLLLSSLRGISSLPSLPALCYSHPLFLSALLLVGSTSGWYIIRRFHFLMKTFFLCILYIPKLINFMYNIKYSISIY